MDIFAVLKATTAEFTTAMGEARGEITKLSTEGSSNMAKLQTVGKAALVGIAAGAVIAGGASVKLAMDYQSSMATVQGSAQLTDAQVKSVGDTFLDTAGRTTFSAQQMATSFGPVAGVVKQLSGGTLTVGSSMQFMQAAMDASEASGNSLSSTTSDLAATMQAFNLSTADAGETANTLFNISRSTGIGLDTLSATVDKLHGRLGIAAPSLADTGTLMVDLAQHGISGSRGVMVVQTAMTTLLGGTKPVNAELKSLGVNVYDSSGKFIGMQAVLAQLSPKLAGMSDAQRQAAETTLFGATSATAMNATLLGGVAAYQKASAAVTAHGAVETAAAAQAKTLHGQMETIKSAGEDIATKLGERLIPMLQTTITTTAQLVNWLSQHRVAAEAVAVVIGAVLTVAIAAYIAHLAVAAVESVKDFATMIASGAEWAAGQLFSLATASAAWAGYLAEWAAKTATATAAWLAEQSTAAATWIAEQATMLASSAAGFVTWAASTVARVTATAAVWIAENVAMAAAATAAFIAENAASLGIVAALAAIVVGVLYVATHWSQVWGDIKAVIADAVDWIRSHALLIGAAFGPVGIAIALLATHWSQVMGGIKTAISDAWSVVKPILDGITTAVNDTIGAINKIGSAISHIPGAGAVASIASHIPGLAAGGIVKAKPGGTLVNVGEGGQDEAVVPLGGPAQISPLVDYKGGGSAARSVTIAQGAVQVIVHGDVNDGNVDTVTGAIDDAMRQLVVELVAT